MTRILLLVTFLISVLPAQEFDIGAPARQGEVIRVAVRNAGANYTSARVRFSEKTVPLFRQDSGELLVLMPVPVDLKPGRYPLLIENHAGEILHQTEIEVQDASFQRQNIRATKTMQTLRPLPGEMEAMRALRDTVSPERYWQDTFTAPAKGCMNSPFGVARYHNNKPTGNYHRGVDIRAPEGRPVYAPADGIVEVARMFRLHGGTVGLDHGQGVVSHYLHLSKIAAKEGDRVNQGQLIGYVGSTGFATGPHLHWGVYVHGLPVNAKQWNPARDWLQPCK